MIAVSCPSCSMMFSAPLPTDGSAQVRVTCPNCRTEFFARAPVQPQNVFRAAPPPLPSAARRGNWDGPEPTMTMQVSAKAAFASQNVRPPMQAARMTLSSGAMADALRQSGVGQQGPTPSARATRPPQVVALSAIGAGAVVLGAALVEGGADGPDIALRILEEAAADLRSPNDAARLRLAKARALLRKRSLRERDIAAVNLGGLRSSTDRHQLAAICRSFASDPSADAAARRRAALLALRAEGTVPAEKTTQLPSADRLAVLLTAGAVADAAPLALAAWLARISDAEALRVAAVAGIRHALALEEGRAPLATRQHAWENAVALWGVTCEWHALWQQLAHTRAGVYGKEISAKAVDDARDATVARVERILNEVSEKHRDADRPEDEALAKRMRHAFDVERDSAVQLARVNGRLGGTVLPASVPFPCGPLTLELLGLRETVFAALQAAAEASPDAEDLAALMGATGEVAEGWALVTQKRHEDAFVYAVMKLKVNPRSREAARLLTAAGRGWLEELLDKKDTEGAEKVVRGWLEHGEVPYEVIREMNVLVTMLLDAEQFERAQKLARDLRGKRDAKEWQPLEARVHYRMGAIANKNQDYPAAMTHLREARALNPDDRDYALAVAQVALNMGFNTKDRQVMSQALAGLGELPAFVFDDPDTRLHAAVLANRAGVEHANAEDLDAAEKVLQQALTLVSKQATGELAEVAERVRGNLAQVLLGQASRIMSRSRMVGANVIDRSRLVGLLRRAAQMGAQEAVQALQQLGEPVHESPFDRDLGRLFGNNRFGGP